MSVQASTWVIENSKQKGSALLVMLMIANHAHADGTNAFPSIQTLARECRMSARQITRIVEALERSGELSVERSAGRLSHRYALPLMQPGQVVTSDNPDKMSTLNPDNLSTLSAPTLTSCPPNPDISDANPDIAVSPEPKEPSEEKSKDTKSHSRVGAASAPPEVKKSSVAEQAREVFAYWRQVHEHPHAVFDEKRRRAIEGRLKEGATPDLIRQAVRGIRRSKFHMGQNDRHRVYDEITLICRDAAHVEQFAALDVVKIKQELRASPPPACRFCADGVEVIVDPRTGGDIQVPCSRCGGRKVVAG